MVRAYFQALGWANSEWDTVPTPKTHNLMIIPCGVMSLPHECLSKKSIYIREFRDKCFEPLKEGNMIDNWKEFEKTS